MGGGEQGAPAAGSTTNTKIIRGRGTSPTITQARLHAAAFGVPEGDILPADHPLALQAFRHQK